MLKEGDIALDPQGSTIKELNEALKTASKTKTQNVGFPEYIGIVKDFILIIEDKKDISFHSKFDDENLLDESVEATKNYALNGAFHYAKHIIEHTNFKKNYNIWSQWK